MKKLWVFLAVIAAGGLLVLGSNFWVLQNVRGNEVVVNGPSYTAPGVLLQLFAGQEGPDTNWIFLGSTDPKARITLIAPAARGIYKGTPATSVRNDGSFEIRIHRRILGILWLPDQTVRFAVPREQLPKVTAATHNDLFAAFRAQLSGMN